MRRGPSLECTARYVRLPFRTPCSTPGFLCFSGVGVSLDGTRLTATRSTPAEKVGGCPRERTTPPTPLRRETLLRTSFLRRLRPRCRLLSPAVVCVPCVFCIVRVVCFCRAASTAGNLTLKTTWDDFQWDAFLELHCE